MAILKTKYRVTWSDVDAAQVVHHSNYFRIFERAEEELYDHLGLSAHHFLEHEVWLPRVEVFCHYKAPSRFGDTLEISLSIDELKKKSVKYSYVVKKLDSDTTLAEGYVIAVAADKKFGKAIKIPYNIAEKLESFKNS